jgi:hypothetical protein
VNRLLDRWIVLAGARDMGELFIPAVAASGRVRRHNAAVALCALLYADACPGMRRDNRAANALALALRALRERDTYAEDQRKLADLRPADPDHQDHLLLRRVAAAQADPLRAVDVEEAVRAAAGRITGWEGADALLVGVEAIDPGHREDLQAVLEGRRPPARLPAEADGLFAF